MRFPKAGILLLACCFTVSFGGYAQAGSATTQATFAEQSAARELFEDANQDRAPEGLQPLRMDAALNRAAWKHARIMVDSGTLSHQLPGEPGLVMRIQQAGAHCSTVAENVAEAPTAAQINDEWMHSESHRANLLDPRVNAIGIAVIKRHGELFAVEDFARETTALTSQQQEQQVAHLLNLHGLQIAGNGARARAYCNGEPARTRPLPRLVMRYSTTDLSRLPQQVEQGITSGRFHRAIVGACEAANENGFSAYQMVILLY